MEADLGLHLRNLRSDHEMGLSQMDRNSAVLPETTIR
jgi:hypothetical protein